MIIDAQITVVLSSRCMLMTQKMILSVSLKTCNWMSRYKDENRWIWGLLRHALSQKPRPIKVFREIYQEE